MSMQASGSGQYGHEELEGELRRALYRFDCPAAHTLGEYQLGLLEPEQRTRIATHAVGCDECRMELQTLRSFLATPINVPQTVVERARRVVANLFSPRAGLAYSGLRGAADTSTRVYEAGDVTVTVGPGQASGTLVGLVVPGAIAPEMLEGRGVRLLPRQGQPLSVNLDDLGNFEFAEIPAGDYVLEIDLADGIIVVEELHID